MEETDAEVFEITDFTTVSEWEKFTGSLVDIFTEWKTLPETHQCSDKLDFYDCQFSVCLCSSTARCFEEKAHLKSAGEVFPSCRVDDSTVSDSVIESGGKNSVALMKGPAKLGRNVEDSPVARSILLADDEFSVEDCIGRRFGVTRFVLVSRETGEIAPHHSSHTLISAIRLALLDSDWDIPVFLMSPPLSCSQTELFHFCCDGLSVSAGSVTEFRDTLLSRAPEHIYCLSGLLSVLKQKLSLSAEQCVSVSMRHAYRCSEYGVLLYSLSALPRPNNVSTSTDLSRSQLKAVISKPLDFLPIRDPVSRLELKAVWSEVSESLVLENTITSLDPFSAPKLTVQAVSDFSPQTTLHNLVLHVCDLHDGVGQIQIGPVDPAVNSLLSELCDAVFSDCIENEEVSSFLPDEIQLWLGRLLSWRLQYRLLWQLACVATFLSGERSQKEVLLYTFWELFIEKVDALWSDSPRRVVDGVSSGPPDHATCSLHQNLQMINYCIEAMGSDLNNSTGDSSDCSSGEEFFDACDSVPPGSGEGRSHVLENITLIETGEPLYVPHTQDIAPLTRDQIQRQADELLAMGSDESGSYRRADYMASTYLRSDMEAFKAANPGATLADFIRWYSPVDWLDDENAGRGCLSERMRAEDNIWRRTWNESQPMPVFRQKRLFQPRAHGLECLDDIKSTPISLVLLQLRSFIAYSSVFRLLSELQLSEVSPLENDLLKLVNIVNTFSHDMSHQTFMSVHLLVWRCEQKVFMYRSLALKLGARRSNYSLLCSLAEGGSVAVEQSDEALRRSLNTVFFADGNNQVQASMKEYLLECCSGSSSVNSADLNQRLFCCTDGSRIRISTALSHDPLFS